MEDRLQAYYVESGRLKLTVRYGGENLQASVNWRTIDSLVFSLNNLPDDLYLAFTPLGAFADGRTWHPIVLSGTAYGLRMTAETEGDTQYLYIQVKDSSESEFGPRQASVRPTPQPSSFNTTAPHSGYEYDRNVVEQPAPPYGT
jgi:hypothetical protein